MARSGAGLVWSPSPMRWWSGSPLTLLFIYVFISTLALCSTTPN